MKRNHLPDFLLLTHLVLLDRADSFLYFGTRWLTSRDSTRHMSQILHCRLTQDVFVRMHKLLNPIRLLRMRVRRRFMCRSVFSDDSEKVLRMLTKSDHLQGDQHAPQLRWHDDSATCTAFQVSRQAVKGEVANLSRASQECLRSN